MKLKSPSLTTDKKQEIQRRLFRELVDRFNDGTVIYFENTDMCHCQYLDDNPTVLDNPTKIKVRHSHWGTEIEYDPDKLGLFIIRGDGLEFIVGDIDDTWEFSGVLEDIGSTGGEEWGDHDQSYWDHVDDLKQNAKSYMTHFDMCD